MFWRRVHWAEVWIEMVREVERSASLDWKGAWRSVWVNLGR